MKAWLNDILDVFRRWLGIRSPSLMQLGYYRCKNCRYHFKEKHQPCTKYDCWLVERWNCPEFKPKRRKKK